LHVLRFHVEYAEYGHPAWPFEEIPMGKFLKSFAYAFRGIFTTIKSERNFKIQMVALVLVIALGFYLGLSAVEWGFVIVAIGFVLVSELFNTALERLSDKVAGGQRDRAIGTVKDISAGAVLVSALTALVIGIIFLFIPLGEKLFST
jgi:diacylglycerol kinase